MNKLIRKLRENFRYRWPMHLVLLLTSWFPDTDTFYRLRGVLVRNFLGSCGKNFQLGRNTTIIHPSAVRIGRDVYLAHGCWLGAGQIEIGNEVMFGPNVVVVAGNHTLHEGSFRFGRVELSPISIGDGTWIGAHVTILAGANIGKGCLLGANTCVTRGNIPDNSLVAGVPGVVKKVLE